MGRQSFNLLLNSEYRPAFLIFPFIFRNRISCCTRPILLFVEFCQALGPKSIFYFPERIVNEHLSFEDVALSLMSSDNLHGTYSCTFNQQIGKFMTEAIRNANEWNLNINFGNRCLHTCAVWHASRHFRQSLSGFFFIILILNCNNAVK